MSVMIPSVMFLIVFAVSITAQQHTEENRIIRIPIERMLSGLERALEGDEENLKIVQAIYEREQMSNELRLARLGARPANDTIPIFKYFETQYYGLINIGKPGKQFKMILDTAWGYTWVPSLDCPKTVIPCATHTRYDHSRSSTYKPDGRPFNSSNVYTGYMSSDLFTLGHTNASGQVFAELTQIPFMNSFYETDGTLGLGLQGLSPNVVPFFYNWFTQNQMAPIFSMFINRDPTTPRGGSLFLGGIDYKHNKTAFVDIPLTGDKFWQFKMDRVTLVMSKKSRQDFCTSGCTAFADTSANTIVGPDADIGTINRLIGATPIPLFPSRFMIPCINTFKGPKVSFTINGKEFIVKAQDYIQRLSYSGLTLCLSAFQPSRGGLAPNTWSLGGAFLYQYYTAYDVQNKVIKIADAA